MEHSAGFLKLVNEAKARVKEITIDEARQRLAKNPQIVLMDVREDLEWQKGHAAQAVHLGKGVLERDLEGLFPEPNREIIMYCGGGFRSILTADVAQKMGYRNVYSLKGGYKALVQGQWPMA
jgi:rhodanese-related sulfurtransferase